MHVHKTKSTEEIFSREHSFYLTIRTSQLLKNPTRHPKQTKQIKFQIVMSTCQEKNNNKKNPYNYYNPQQRCARRTNALQARIVKKKSTSYKFMKCMWGLAKWIKILKSSRYRLSLCPCENSFPCLLSNVLKGTCRTDNCEKAFFHKYTTAVF